MFIRLKNNGDEKNIIISSITHFEPSGDGSIIHLVANGSVTVAESNRTIRNAIKKASAPEVEDALQP